MHSAFRSIPQEGPACAAECDQGSAAQQLVKLFALHDRLWELVRRSRTHKAKALPGLTQVDPFLGPLLQAPDLCDAMSLQSGSIVSVPHRRRAAARSGPATKTRARAPQSGRERRPARLRRARQPRRATR